MSLREFCFGGFGGGGQEEEQCRHTSRIPLAKPPAQKQRYRGLSGLCPLYRPAPRRSCGPDGNGKRFRIQTGRAGSSVSKTTVQDRLKLRNQLSFAFTQVTTEPPRRGESPGQASLSPKSQNMTRSSNRSKCLCVCEATRANLHILHSLRYLGC